MSESVFGLPLSEGGLDDGDIVTDAVVVAKVVGPSDGEAKVCVFTSGGLDWITQVGLLEVAHHYAMTGDDDA